MVSLGDGRDKNFRTGGSGITLPLQKIHCPLVWFWNEFQMEPKHSSSQAVLGNVSLSRNLFHVYWLHVKQVFPELLHAALGFVNLVCYLRTNEQTCYGSLFWSGQPEISFKNSYLFSKDQENNQNKELQPELFHWSLAWHCSILWIWMTISGWNKENSIEKSRHVKVEHFLSGPQDDFTWPGPVKVPSQ